LNGEVKGTSKKMGSGRYEVTDTTDGKTGSETHWTFENNGSKVTQELLNKNGLSVSSVYEYEGDRLLSEARTVYGRSKISYHYSDKGFLDSVVSYVENDTAAGKVMKFINNEYGDPVFLIEIQNGNTTYSRRIKYRYDEKGNWTRRLVHETGLPDNYLRVSKNPEYTLTIRRIIY
jgi:hypothetical protein